MNIKISKLANWYYFVFILSQDDDHPDFGARKKYLVKETNKLSKEDLDNLEKFTEIGDSFKNIPLDVVFTVYNNPWIKAKEEIGDSKTKKLKKILLYFKGRFDAFWIQEKNKMIEAVNYYKKNKHKLSGLIKDFSVLLGIEHFDFNKVPIHFLFSEPKGISGWFSVMSGKEDIVLECSGYEFSSKDNFPLAVLAHEFFHLVLRESDLMKDLFLVADQNEKILKKIGFGGSSALTFEELLVSCFMPEGYLAEKKLGLKMKDYRKKLVVGGLKDFSLVRRRVAYLMKKETKKCVDNMIRLDRSYLEKIIDKLKEASSWTPRREK